MPLQSMTTMLRKARDGRYAVGAFSVPDYLSMRAVVLAAAQAGAPVIVQTSPRTVRFWGCRALAAWARELAEDSPVAVALHLDHGREMDMISDCIAAGYTSVMIDASSDPFEENLDLTRRVIAIAQPVGVSVEAELGRIGGVEDNRAGNDADTVLADPDQAARFCNELALDCLAPAVGTAHGEYRREPDLDFDRLEDIARRTAIPLALHGGTGLAQETLLRCIALGCAKINISTRIKRAFLEAFVTHHRDDKNGNEPLAALGAQQERIREEVLAAIRMFGSRGKAD